MNSPDFHYKQLSKLIGLGTKTRITYIKMIGVKILFLKKYSVLFNVVCDCYNKLANRTEKWGKSYSFLRILIFMWVFIFEGGGGGGGGKILKDVYNDFFKAKIC